MAIAVPFLIANTAMGVAAATAIGVSVGTLATVTAVAFQVTGVNDKINKVAGKVFGEDLVNVANLAGMVYGAVNGGFAIDGVGPNTAATTGGLGIKAPVPDASASQYSLAGAGEAVPPASTGSVFDKLGVSAESATVTPIEAPDLSGVKPLEPLQPTATASNTVGKNMLTNAPSGVDPQRSLAQMAADASAVPTPEPTAAAAPNAAASKATLSPGQSLAKLAANDATAANAASSAASTADAGVQSWFKKNLGVNLGSEKATLGMIQGAAGVYDSNNKRKAAIEAAQAQRRHIYAGPTFRLTQG